MIRSWRTRCGARCGSRVCQGDEALRGLSRSRTNVCANSLAQPTRSQRAALRCFGRVVASTPSGQRALLLCHLTLHE